MASWHRPGLAAKGIRAGPRQADAQGVPRRGGAAGGGSPLASPWWGVHHVDEGAEEVALGMVVGAGDAPWRWIDEMGEKGWA
jgi:hypothetical protein